MNLMSLSTSWILLHILVTGQLLLRSSNNVSLATSMHSWWSWKSSHSCIRVLYSIIRHIIVVVRIHNNTSDFTWNFVHPMSRKWLSSMWRAILIRHLLLHLIIVLAAMIWLRPSLREQMSASSGLAIWSRWMPGAVVIFTDVQHSLRLLMNHKFIVLPIQIVRILCTIPLPNGWYVTVWGLWADSCGSVMFTTLTIVLSIICSGFVGFIAHHLILMNIVIVVVHILLLGHLEILNCVCSELFGSWNSSNWSAYRITLIFTGSLTVVTFLFNHELTLLPSSWHLLLYLNLILDCSMSVILVVRVIKLSKFLLRLIWCKFRVCVSLRQNSWDRNSTTHWINFALSN